MHLNRYRKSIEEKEAEKKIAHECIQGNVKKSGSKNAQTWYKYSYDVTIMLIMMMMMEPHVPAERLTYNLDRCSICFHAYSLTVDRHNSKKKNVKSVLKD